MLGPGIICASVPVTVGYSIHALRKSTDKGWAVLAVLMGALMTLPVIWAIVMILFSMVAE